MFIKCILCVAFSDHLNRKRLLNFSKYLSTATGTVNSNELNLTKPQIYQMRVLNAIDTLTILNETLLYF